MSYPGQLFPFQTSDSLLVYSTDMIDARLGGWSNLFSSFGGKKTFRQLNLQLSLALPQLSSLSLIHAFSSLKQKKKKKKTRRKRRALFHIACVQFWSSCLFVCDHASKRINPTPSVGPISSFDLWYLNPDAHLYPGVSHFWTLGQVDCFEARVSAQTWDSLRWNVKSNESQWPYGIQSFLDSKTIVNRTWFPKVQIPLVRNELSQRKIGRTENPKITHRGSNWESCLLSKNSRLQVIFDSKWCFCRHQNVCTIEKRRLHRHKWWWDKGIGILF